MSTMQIDIKGETASSKLRGTGPADATLMIQKVQTGILGCILFFLVIIFGLMAGLTAYMAPAMKGINSIAQIVPTSIPQTMTSILQMDIGTIARNTEGVCDGFIDGTASVQIPSSMGYTMASLVSGASSIKTFASTFMTWSKPGESTNDAWGGAINKVFGTDPLSWIQKQVDMGDIEALMRTCVAVEAQLETTLNSWPSLTVGNYAYNEETQKVERSSYSENMFTVESINSVVDQLKVVKQGCESALNGLKAD